MPDGLGIVLPGEDLVRTVQGLPGSGLQDEGTVLAAEFPDDPPGAQADLVGGPGVPCVDQQVPVGVQVDGQETEVPTLVPTLTCDQVKALLGGLKFRPEACAAAVADPALLATDLVDYLVRKGVPFRANEVPNSTRRQIFVTDPNNVLIELNFDVAKETPAR